MNADATVEDGEGPGARVLRYLLNVGVLSPREAVRAPIVAEDVSVSHQAFLVRIGGIPRWFVKQADPIRSRGRTLGTEADVYRLASARPDLRRVVPHCLMIGRNDQILVLEAVNAEPLSALLTRDEFANSFSKLLRVYGAAVALIHSFRPPPFGAPPWLLVALEPTWGNYEWLPESCGRFLWGLARNPVFSLGFARLRREWRRAALIHGDIRWANALATVDNGPPQVRIVDWELSCVGDPAWDIGSLLADVVATSMLVRGRDDVLAWSRFLLEGYRESATANHWYWPQVVDASFRMAAARLVQTIIEYGHSSDADLVAAERALIPWAIKYLVESPALAASMTSARSGTRAS